MWPFVHVKEATKSPSWRWGVCCSEGPRHRIEDRWIIVNRLQADEKFQVPQVVLPVGTEDCGNFIERQTGEMDVTAQTLPSIWAVYDGHGGSKCCDFVRQELHNNVLKYVAPSLWGTEVDLHKLGKGIAHGFRDTEQEFRRIAMDTKTGSGSCVAMVLLAKGHLIVANLGDSRVVVGRKRHELAALYMQSKARAVKLSKEHKPSKKAEKARIEKLLVDLEKATGENLRVPQKDKILPVHKGRAFGILAISRSLGDIPLKIPLPLEQLVEFLDSKAKERGPPRNGVPEDEIPPSPSTTAEIAVGDSELKSDSLNAKLGRWESIQVVPEVVSAEPEIRFHSLEERDWFVVLATDGLWDVCNCFYVVDEIGKMLSVGHAVDAIAESLVQEARNRGSRDDITVLILVFGC